MKYVAVKRLLTFLTDYSHLFLKSIVNGFIQHIRCITYHKTSLTLIHDSVQQFLDLTRAFKAIASEARLAPALVGSSSVQTVSMVAALVGASCTLIKVWNWKKPICTLRSTTDHKCFPEINSYTLPTQSYLPSTYFRSQPSWHLQQQLPKVFTHCLLYGQRFFPVTHSSISEGKQNRRKVKGPMILYL